MKNLIFYDIIIHERMFAKVANAEVYMIKNVVFDLGMVLVRFDPDYMVRKYINEPEEDVELLRNVVFDRLYWDRLDDGTIEDEEVVTEIKKRIPERLWDVAEKIYYNWVYNLPEIEGMRELVCYIKEKYGVKLVILSNTSVYLAEHSHEVSPLDLFDECIFSGACKMVKPDKEIFEYLCSSCEINAEETVFIDDNEKNIEGARDCGICGYLFDGDAKRLRAYLDTLLSDN